MNETKLAVRLANVEKSLARLETVSRKPLDEEYVNLDATVHRFNTAYEVLLKALDTHLGCVHRMPPSERGRSNFERLQVAFRVGLIDDDQVWTRIRKARNATVHEYDPDQALALYRAVKTYVPQLRSLLQRMRSGSME